MIQSDKFDSLDMNIKKIEIFSEKLKNNKILNFENNKNTLFYMIRNDELYNLLTMKITAELANFFISILDESNLSLCII